MSRDMLGRAEALSVQAALEIILQSLPKEIKIEAVPLEQAFGRVLASDINSTEDVPAFARSTMDGYAVRARDSFGASDTAPAYLELKGEILMGEEPTMKLGAGEALRISTGGMLPEGADAVLMLEHSERVDDTMIEAHKPVAPGDNVVQRGEDFKAGQPLIKQGRRLRPQDVASLASLGQGTVSVYQKPRVALVSTGDEIIPLGTPLRPGLVRDSNSYHLQGMVMDCGCLPLRKGIIRDEAAALREAVAGAAASAEAVVITGGSSVGARDLSERIIAELGRVLFHSVALRPGKPLIAGVIEGKPVFGLPGHPRAVQVCFEVFVRPALERLAGLSEETISLETRKHLKARMTKSVASSAGRQDMLSVTLELLEGQWLAHPIMAKSGILTTMVRAHGSVTIPAEQLGLEAGQEVDVRLS